MATQRRGSTHFRCLFVLKVRSNGDIFAPIFVVFLVVILNATEYNTE